MFRLTRLNVCVILVLCASPASSQDFCGTIAAVVAQAPSKFQSLRGPRDAFGDYGSHYMLPGATQCYVSGDDFDFVCKWRGVPEDSDTAKAKLARGIQQCYPQARAVTRNSSRGPSYSIRANGILFRIHANDRQTVFLGIGLDN